MLSPDSLRYKSNALEREQRLKEKRIREEEKRVREEEIRYRKQKEEERLRREADIRKREKERLLREEELSKQEVARLLREEELRQQEVARLLKEEERKSQIEAQRLRDRELADQQLKEDRELIQEVVVKAIIHATQVSIYTRAYDVNTCIDDRLAASRLKRDLIGLGFECFELPRPFKGVINKIISGLTGNIGGRNYRQALILELSKYLDEVDLIFGLVSQISKDKNLNLDVDTQLSVNSFLAEFSDALLCVKWKSTDTLEVDFDELHQVPSWIASTSGAGLMGRIDECMGADAALGRRSSNFALTFLSINTERWGRNKMTQFKYSEEPIGVCPFPLDVILLMFKTIGFDASVKNKYVPTTLSIAW